MVLVFLQKTHLCGERTLARLSLLYRKVPHFKPGLPSSLVVCGLSCQVGLGKRNAWTARQKFRPAETGSAGAISFQARNTQKLHSWLNQCVQSVFLTWIFWVQSCKFWSNLDRIQN